MSSVRQAIAQGLLGGRGRIWVRDGEQKWVDWSGWVFERDTAEVCAESRPVADSWPHWLLSPRAPTVCNMWVGGAHLRELVIDSQSESLEVSEQLSGSVHGTPARQEEP